MAWSHWEGASRSFARVRGHYHEERPPKAER